MTNEELLLERLASIEARLEGVERIESQLAAFNRPFENLSDLGRDLSLLMDPAVRKLTEEMVEVEIGFQLEDFFALIKRLLPSLKYLTWSMEQLENLVDWWQDMEPVLKLAVPKVIDYLDNLEQKGIFRINGAVIEMYGKIADNYKPEDIARHGRRLCADARPGEEIVESEVDPIPGKTGGGAPGGGPGGGQTGGAVRDDVEDAERGLPAGPGGHAGTDPGAGQAEGRTAGAGCAGGNLKNLTSKTPKHQVSPSHAAGGYWRY